MGEGAIKLGKENPCHQNHFYLFHSTQVTYDMPSMTLCVPAQRQRETHSLANVTELVNTEVKISKQDPFDAKALCSAYCLHPRVTNQMSKSIHYPLRMTGTATDSMNVPSAGMAKGVSTHKKEFTCLLGIDKRRMRQVLGR